MKPELELKLQAWVDGELHGAEAQHIAALAAQDPAAAQLAHELRAVKAALTGAEMERCVPASREFYWSQITRQIEAESRQPVVESPHWLTGWRRFLMPLAGVAVAACVMLTTVKQSTVGVGPSAYDEVTSAGEAMESTTFHDQSAGMTVVWLQDRATPAPAISQPNSDDNSILTD